MRISQLDCRLWLRALRQGVPLALIVLMAAILRLLALQYDYLHPDELISVGVAEAVRASGTLDTNWQHADLPTGFRYPQYNFSAYLLFAAGMLTIKSWLASGTGTLLWLRGCSAILGTVAVALTYLAGRRLFGKATGLCAAVFATIFPLLYQDSLYARPETFATVLTLLLVALVASGASRTRACIAAFLLGLLVATKVSMLLLAPLLLLPILGTKAIDAVRNPSPGFRLSPAFQTGFMLALFVLAGFMAGAPYAVTHPEDFVYGIEKLRSQYAGSHWPYGVYGGTLPDRLAHAASYFYGTTGWLIPLAVLGGVFAARKGEFRALLMLLVAVATLLQFSAYPVFFERNVSHVMPLFAIFAGYALVLLAGMVKARPAVRTALLVVCVGLVGIVPARIVATLLWNELPGKQQKRVEQKRAAMERQWNMKSQVLLWTAPELHSAIGYRCDGPLLLELPNLGDARSMQLLGDLQTSEGFREVGRVEGQFPQVPPSTLQTYFTPPVIFLYRPPGTAVCRSNGGYVAAASAGAALPVLALETEPAWTKGGAYPDEARLFPAEEVFGSWSGADANHGRLRLTVSVDGEDVIVLPFVNGPVSKRQRIEIFDAAGGQPLMRVVSPIPKLRGWQLLVVRVPAGTKALRIEAADEGSGWGEWQAIGIPRRLKDF